MGRPGTFAHLVREALEQRGQATVTELTQAVLRTAPAEMVAGRKVRPMVQAALRDLLRSGEVTRVEIGRYGWARRAEKVQIRAKMWSILRSRRVVSVEDLMELSGASRGYARQWTTMLEGHEIVRRLDDGRVQLVADPVVQPDDEVKAAQLRKIRRKKALQTMGEALQAAGEALEVAGNALQTMAEACKELEDAS
jgi:hypothetical protein